ncbi:MAG TPA: tryptophan-rich sensory protein [Spirochaetota bacterium]|mgnify:CR=1 FL=1|nr:tryptophan-rich sensory protein [Spirochaetota bacterium]HPC42225.1 tryptophan-rich sensory protein [Spirochaetota bacterium]HPL17084.1 tryptophan-rich sensory protein [Spirochaetota bacterium]HQF08205.1 tryptophan-rich sensory protein [Spirochaetota bacterium]HQH97180.1 tryptophan-rich sensory protein [Spirochaetota bacterium]
METGKRSNIFKLIASIIIPQAAGGIGALMTEPSVGSWYSGLNKPSFNPPDWIFGPVWTALYLMMGIALYLVWKKGLSHKETRAAVAAFGVQLFLNLAWSFLFFYLHMPFAAFIEIILLWFAIAATMAAFARVSRAACRLLVPYLLWVSFASVLNFFLWRLNP